MKKIILIIMILSWLLLNFWSYTLWEDWWATSNWGNWECKWVKLNTDIPWVGKCIKQDQAWNAFSTLMWSMMKLLVNITVAVAFISLIAAGVMMTVSGVSQSTAWKWKELLKKVVLWIVLLGLSWLILHAINPNFFKTGLNYQLLKKLKY